MIAFLGWCEVSQAQLRIVTYNTTHGPASGMDIVLKSIGEEIGNNGKAGGNLLTDGIAKPIDILLLQEQSNSFAGANSPSADTLAFVNLLNSPAMYGPGAYSMTTRTGFGDTTQTLVYRTSTVELLSDTAFGSAGQPRQTLRYQLRPVGYGSNADFYIYNSHYKAGNTSSDNIQKNNEAGAIRANSDALLEGAHIIYTGDHNFYRSDSSEPAWGTLTAAGAGQANDPINRVGTWTNNSSFADVHTQSPCTVSNGNCGTTGGMDDRFDFQLVSGEFLDGEGLSYIPNSYHAFGNNGSTFNMDINSVANSVTFPPTAGSTTTTFPNGSTYTKSQILNALRSVTDHIPVVADYQVPAVMQAVAAAIPSSIDLGSPFNLNVTVSNAANVITVNGADELDYSLTTSGSVSGSYLNQIDNALGGGNVHSISLNTSSIGSKSGTVMLTSTSQGVQNPSINIPINFLVVLPGDYNGNGEVDAADYNVWRENMGLTGGATYAQGDGDRDGNVTIADYNLWRSHFGQTASGAGAGFGGAVPEPSSLALLLFGTCLAFRRPTRLKAWTSPRSSR